MISVITVGEKTKKMVFITHYCCYFSCSLLICTLLYFQNCIQILGYPAASVFNKLSNILVRFDKLASESPAMANNRRIIILTHQDMIE